MHNEHSRFDTPEGRFVSTVLRQAMDLITVDRDEEKILDYLGLRDHPKAANEGHLKTGQR